MGSTLALWSAIRPRPATALSGPGRLHDLFVPLGACLVATTARGVCALRFVESGAGRDAVSDLQAEWPEADLVEDTEATAPIARMVLAGLSTSAESPLRLLLKGTNLQVQAWRALLAIPEGRVVSYEDVARSVGRPSAVRAVTSAIGRNPVAVLIPCHRVLRKSGDWGDYRWGVGRKRALLAWEAGRQPVSATA